MQKIEIIRGAYYDSVTLMLTAKEVGKLEGVGSSSLSMGTDANRRIMTNGGFDLTGVDAAPADLMIAVLGDSEKALKDAIAKAREYLAKPPWKKASGTVDYSPKSLNGALSIMPDANLAIVSVAGQYASEIASECIDSGLNVMIFSDNVPLEREIELKKRAAEKGLLVMGPDCGTAIIRGAALGMANICPVGPVGIVAAAGTGLQEIHTQLARRGVGVLHGIGVGGRDVSREVGGMSMLAAIDALAADEEISVILVVGKPPAPETERKVLAKAKSAGKPVVISFIGGTAQGGTPALWLCTELEAGGAIAAALATGGNPLKARRTLEEEIESETSLAIAKIGKRKGHLRGLYTGGTLCYEAQLIASRTLGTIWSNAPLDKKMLLTDSLTTLEHSIVDFGDDEFTQGKLHPMIDPAFRSEMIVKEAAKPETAVILLDVVLGYGCHEDPAGAAAEAVRTARSLNGDRVAFIASVCGSEGDPQGMAKQIEKLEKSGVYVCSSNARAAHLAAGLIG